MSDEIACFAIPPIGNAEYETRNRSDQQHKHLIPDIEASGDRN